MQHHSYHPSRFKRTLDFWCKNRDRWLEADDFIDWATDTILDNPEGMWDSDISEELEEDAPSNLTPELWKRGNCCAYYLVTYGDRNLISCDYDNHTREYCFYPKTVKDCWITASTALDNIHQLEAELEPKIISYLEKHPGKAFIADELVQKLKLSVDKAVFSKILGVFARKKILKSRRRAGNAFQLREYWRFCDELC